MKIKLVAVLAIIALLVGSIPIQPVLAVGTTYYVAKTGSDSTGDGSLGDPWLTIDHAVDTIVAGDTVYIETGTYNEAVTMNNLNGAGSYTTIQNYNSQSVIIDGTGVVANSALFLITNCSYVNIIGLEICNTDNCSGLSQVYGANSNHANFTDLYIHDCDHSGMNIGSYTTGLATNFTVDNCTIYNTNLELIHAEELQLLNISNFEVKNCTVGKPNVSDNVDIVSCSNGTVHHNDLENLYIDAYGEDVTNIDVYDNLFHDSDYAGGTHSFLGCEVTPASVTDINFFNNIYYNTYPSTDTGVFVVYGEAGGFTAVTFTFTNNTIYAVSGAGWTDVIFGDATGNYSSCVVANNIFVMRASTSIPIMWKYWANGGVTIDYNLLYSLSGGLYPEWSNGNKITYGANAVLANPLLINPSNHNFKLNDTSPAIDAASATYAPADDYMGTARPQDGVDDIGAYEYLSTAIPFINGTTTFATINGVATIATINGE